MDRKACPVNVYANRVRPFERLGVQFIRTELFTEINNVGKKRNFSIFRARIQKTD